jgi:hypothetical protein
MENRFEKPMYPRDVALSFLDMDLIRRIHECEPDYEEPEKMAEKQSNHHFCDDYFE